MSPLIFSKSLDISNFDSPRDCLKDEQLDEAVDQAKTMLYPEQKNKTLYKIALYWINTKHNRDKALEVIAICTNEDFKRAISNFAKSGELIPLHISLETV